MARIALKIDVDTWRGTHEGVPALMQVLQAVDVGATFLFSLGPDHTGRAIFRALRPGFLRKVARTSVLEHYGLRTMLFGTLLPGPDIGRREAATLRRVRESGFEVGVHCWDHVRWQDQLMARDAGWALQEMRRATQRHAEIFGTAPILHGAAGWQFNAAAARAERQLGIRFASDTRGTHPFQPVDDDCVPLGPPQFPTTLPTLDELIGIDHWQADNVHEALLARTAEVQTDQVYTLHAELEGQRLLPVLQRLIAGWRAQGHTLVSLGELRDATDLTALPHHRMEMGSVPGRSGLLAVQGALMRAQGDSVTEPPALAIR